MRAPHVPVNLPWLWSLQGEVGVGFFANKCRMLDIGTAVSGIPHSSSLLVGSFPFSADMNLKTQDSLILCGWVPAKVENLCHFGIVSLKDQSPPWHSSGVPLGKGSRLLQ